jgi:hypothetical protein
MKRVRRWILPAILVTAAAFGLVYVVGTAVNVDDPEAQLAAMLPAERDFCEQVLARILPKSNGKHVVEVLGNPDRDLMLKKNWWVKLGGKRDRVGVFFDTAGLATDVVLDGGPGRFYYRRPVKDHVGMTQEKEPTPEAAADEASEPAATPIPQSNSQKRETLEIHGRLASDNEQGAQLLRGLMVSQFTVGMALEDLCGPASAKRYAGPTPTARVKVNHRSRFVTEERDSCTKLNRGLRFVHE